MFEGLLRIFLILWGIIFITRIGKSISSFIGCLGAFNVVHNCLSVAANVINQSDHNIDMALAHDEDYLSAKNKMLSQYPVIEKYKTSHYIYLSYGMDDHDLLENAKSIYNNLRMKLNYVREEIFASLNPLLSLKYIFTIPARFLKLLGFKPSNTASKIINVVSILFIPLLLYILDLYSIEVKAFLDSIFKPGA